MKKTILKTIGKSRENGYTIKALMEFYKQGMQGKSVIYRSFEGDFLSPKAVKQLLYYKDKEKNFEIHKLQSEMVGLEIVIEKLKIQNKEYKKIISKLSN